MDRVSRAAFATALLLSGVVVARPRIALAQRAPVTREALEALEASLDRAVGQVSRPAPGIVLGRAESARGYHLPGYGAVFVLAPRALPRGGGVFALRARKAPAGRTRPQLQASVERGGEQRVVSPEFDELLAIEQQVLEFQREAEEARQSAELEFERLSRDLHNRLAAPPASPRPAGAPVVPVAPVAGASASSPAPPPSALGLPPGPESSMPPPPWRFWLPTDGPSDDRPPDAIVADVRAAVIATLAGEGARLRGLATDEFVAVAIDFVPVGVFVSEARPARTILIRARKKDLDARQAGKLSAEELQSRVEVSEY
jgi:hypothetical protein